MHWNIILRILGSIAVILSFLTLISGGIGLVYKERVFFSFLVSSFIGMGVGLLFLLLPVKKDHGLSHREAYALVTFSWLIACFLGSIPYLTTGVISNFTDAFFESVSGFTTTGATVLTGLESTPKSILFWRSLTQWLGGMGIIVLTVAILPFLGVGGMEIYKAEV
ncbi:MAG: potassium transporter TrkG, partial [Desulfatiglandales bacterium]